MSQELVKRLAAMSSAERKALERRCMVYFQRAEIRPAKVVQKKRAKRAPNKIKVTPPQLRLIAGGLPGNPRFKKRKDPSQLKGEFTI